MANEILQTFKKLPETEYILGSQKALNNMNNVRLFFSFFSFDLQPHALVLSLLLMPGCPLKHPSLAIIAGYN